MRRAEWLHGVSQHRSSPISDTRDDAAVRQVQLAARISKESQRRHPQRCRRRRSIGASDAIIHVARTTPENRYWHTACDHGASGEAQRSRRSQARPTTNGEPGLIGFRAPLSIWRGRNRSASAAGRGHTTHRGGSMRIVKLNTRRSARERQAAGSVPAQSAISQLPVVINQKSVATGRGVNEKASLGSNTPIRCKKQLPCFG